MGAEGYEQFGGEYGGATCIVVDPCGRRVQRCAAAEEERNEVSREEAGNPAILAVVGQGHGVVEGGH